MQALGGTITAADLLAKVKEGVRHKFEILVGTTWVELTAWPSLRDNILPGWPYRKRITLPVATETLTDFPVLVKFTDDADIGATCNFQGDDIRFTAADGETLLAFERETFAVAAGAASGEFWVKVPTITTSGATIYIYWGNATSANGEDAEGVWDANYKAVWHMWDMNEAAQVFDSTVNGNDGTKSGSTQATGKIGYGQDFDGTDDYIGVTPVGSLSALTAEAWVKFDDLTALSEILRASGEPWPSFRIQNDSLILKLDAWDATGYASAAITGDGAWKHVVATWDSTAQAIKLYVDGALVATATGIDTAAQDMNWPAGCGSDPAAENYVNGLLDEIRASSIARSAGWIAYEYSNMATDAGGLTWGGAETVPQTQDLLKAIDVTQSGAGITPDPISGQWSATFSNPGGIFNPFHPTSAYKDYFRIGRQVRISAGIVKSGAVTYWTRLCGFMDEPSFDGDTVSVQGSDFMGLLADTKLHDPYTHWGTHEHFTSIATGGAGTELYAESDACTIGAGEANSVSPWAVGGSGGAVASVAGDSSTFALQFTRDVIGPTEQYVHNSSILTMVAEQSYVITFKGKIMAGTNYARLIAYETIGGAASYLGEVTIPYEEGLEGEYQFAIKSNSASALQLRLTTGGKYATAADSVRIDNISVKTWDPGTWYKYELPAVCTGVYAVTLAGEFVAHGDEDADSLQESGGGGWHYEDAGSSKWMCFSKNMKVEAGLDIAVYYFTAQAVDDVVADLLVAGSLYSTRPLALADMDYDPTGVSIERVWFEASTKPGSGLGSSGTSAREAARMLCERTNYRFWFSGPGVPTFRHADTLAATADLTFASVGNLGKGTGQKQDRSSIVNRVSIEGEEQSVEPGTGEKPTKLTGEALDQDSIDLYNERPWSISNHLFQDQASIDAMKAEIIAERKGAKWFLALNVPFFVAPVEIGDSITLQVPLTPATSVEKKAIVRGVSYDLKMTRFRCEVAEGYPVVPVYPDIGSHENQKGTVPVSVAVADIGAHENQKT